MNEYDFVTQCKHEGTIKPVKSSGKHAGKWFCRIKGPKVDALGMNVKTLYTAPFLGAAKASIAKFLCITVAAVEVTSSASGERVDNTPINQQKAASKSTNEFDTSDDDEFANFDLNAAILSATKQSATKKPAYLSSKQPTKQALPPQYPVSNYKPSTSDAASNDLRKELENLRVEKDRLNKEVFSAKQEAGLIRQENDRMTKETEEAKDEKARLKGQIRAIREEQEKLQSDLNSVKQQRQAEKTKHEAEVNELDVEKNKLKGQIRALQEQRDELKCDIKSAIQTKKDEKELKEIGAEKSKLKGQVRALQEQYDQLKSDITLVTKKKDCAEKEAQAALLKKEEYEMDVKTASLAKKELESHRKAVLEAGRKATAGEEPPTKRQKTGKQVKGGTIVKSMKVAELKEEALARGIDVKELASMNKDALLSALVVGSPRITKTDAWDEIVTLRKTFADERQKAAQLERRRQQEAAELERQRREEIYRRQEQQRREEERKWKEQREKNRAEEISKQGEFHSLKVPKNVHKCKLAFTKDLCLHGSPRSYNTACTECGGRYDVEYSCEQCDFDICNKCFKEKTMTPAEKKAEAKRKAAEEKERQKAAAEWRRREEEEEAKHLKKWDPKTHFADKIVNPSDTNKDPDGNKSKGFTVWCSDGYGNDGWHSYEGAPAKEFDTTYATKEEANDRARFLFQWKNPWGWGAEEFEERLICSEKSTKTGLAIPKQFWDEYEVTNTRIKDGMVTYAVTPADSTTWTVSVVPDAAFAYLDNAKRARHYHDGEDGDGEVDYEETAGNFGYSFGCF